MGLDGNSVEGSEWIGVAFDCDKLSYKNEVARGDEKIKVNKGVEKVGNSGIEVEKIIISEGGLEY